MNKIPAIVSVLAISGGMIAASAAAVPYISASTQKLEQPSAVNHKGSEPILKIKESTEASTVKGYLDNVMTQEEIRQIQIYIDNRKEEAEASTRSLDEAEEKRLRTLKSKYIHEGVRPKAALPLQAGEARFYLDMDKQKLVLPEPSLTDEELLQYIDWKERVDYALAQRVQKIMPEAKDITEKQAVLKARTSIANLFDFDPAKLEVQAAYNKVGPDQRGIWFVHYQPRQQETLEAEGKEYRMYDVIVDSLSGDVLDTTIFNSAYQRTPITEENLRSIKRDSGWIQKAEAIVIKQAGETRDIQEITYIDNKLYRDRGVVALRLALEDGSSYLAELRYPDQSLRCLLYEPAGRSMQYPEARK